jgi:NDP-hexose-3-ketoreductase
VPAEQPLTLGVLGCAEIARRRMLPAFAASADVTLTAIASRDGTKAVQWAARYPGCSAVAGYPALLERADIDAVYIPLPTGLHVEWALRALHAGKHVLVEKPAATTEADAAALTDRARRCGRMLVENFMFLRHSQHRAVRDLCQQGAIGQIRAFRGCFGVPGLDPANVRYRTDLDGGALQDAAVYPMLAARYLLGEDLELIGAVLHHDGGVDLGGEILLSTPSKVTVSACFGFVHGYRSEYELWGSAGRLRLDRAYTPPAAWQPVVELYRQDSEERRTLPADDQVANAVTHFVRCVRGIEAADDRTVVAQAALVEAVRKTAPHAPGSA